MIWNCIDLAYSEQLGEGQYVEGYQQALKDVWRNYFQIDKLSDTEKIKLAKKLQKILNKIEKENKDENHRNNY